jgi:peptidoglycan/LPS O-acetylase OafA/YrhL
VVLFHGWMLSAWTLRPSDGALVNGAYRVLSLGWSGVDLFFTLSAFLLSLPFVRAAQVGQPRPDPLAYLKRRVWRIGLNRPGNPGDSLV